MDGAERLRGDDDAPLPNIWDIYDFNNDELLALWSRIGGGVVGSCAGADGELRDAVQREMDERSLAHKLYTGLQSAVQPPITSTLDPPPPNNPPPAIPPAGIGTRKEEVDAQHASSVPEPLAAASPAPPLTKAEWLQFCPPWYTPAAVVDTATDGGGTDPSAAGVATADASPLRGRPRGMWDSDASSSDADDGRGGRKEALPMRRVMKRKKGGASRVTRMNSLGIFVVETTRKKVKKAAKEEAAQPPSRKPGVPRLSGTVPRRADGGGTQRLSGVIGVTPPTSTMAKKIVAARRGGERAPPPPSSAEAQATLGAAVGTDHNNTINDTLFGGDCAGGAAPSRTSAGGVGADRAMATLTLCIGPASTPAAPISQPGLMSSPIADENDTKSPSNCSNGHRPSSSSPSPAESVSAPTVGDSQNAPSTAPSLPPSLPLATSTSLSAASPLEGPSVEVARLINGRLEISRVPSVLGGSLLVAGGIGSRSMRRDGTDPLRPAPSVVDVGGGIGSTAGASTPPPQPSSKPTLMAGAVAGPIPPLLDEGSGALEGSPCGDDSDGATSVDGFEGEDGDDQYAPQHLMANPSFDGALDGGACPSAAHEGPIQGDPCTNKGASITSADERPLSKTASRLHAVIASIQPSSPVVGDASPRPVRPSSTFREPLSKDAASQQRCRGAHAATPPPPLTQRRTEKRVGGGAGLIVSSRQQPKRAATADANGAGDKGGQRPEGRSSSPSIATLTACASPLPIGASRSGLRSPLLGPPPSTSPLPSSSSSHHYQYAVQSVFPTFEDFLIEPFHLKPFSKLPTQVFIEALRRLQRDLEGCRAECEALYGGDESSDEDGARRRTSSSSAPLSSLPSFNGMLCKIQRTRTEVYSLILGSLVEGDGVWREVDGPGWNLWWSWNRPLPRDAVWLAVQRANHIPKSKELTHKDLLKRNIFRYAKGRGQGAAAFRGLMPLTFVLPSEYLSFVQSFGEVGGSWIIKVLGQSRGRGITVINRLEKVAYSDPVVIQRYVDRPLLLDGHKFDLRLYVVVTQFNPLECFVSSLGFVRIASVAYDPATIDDKYAHITNTSVSREYKESTIRGGGGSPFYSPSGGAADEESEEEDDVDDDEVSIAMAQLKRRSKGLPQLPPKRASPSPAPTAALSSASSARVPPTKGRFREDTKWLLSKLAAHLDGTMGAGTWDRVWASINTSIVRTLACAEDNIPYNPCCFELFGFDVLLDEDLSPWVLEVNASPAMDIEGPEDAAVKPSVIRETVALLDMPPINRDALLDVVKARLHALTAKRQSHRFTAADTEAHIASVLGNHPIRAYGEMPAEMGHFTRLAPSAEYDATLKHKRTSV